MPPILPKMTRPATPRAGALRALPLTLPLLLALAACEAPPLERAPAAPAAPLQPQVNAVEGAAPVTSTDLPPGPGDLAGSGSGSDQATATPGDDTGSLTSDVAQALAATSDTPDTPDEGPLPVPQDELASGGAAAADPSDSCGMDPYLDLVGQTYDESMMADRTGPYRVIPENGQMTMDHRPDRLTIHLDAAGRVAAIRCI
ncbi:MULTISPECIES: I78 family peptidase inhibitor [Pseudooceanicola]|nr:MULTISPECIES: I78 family peptidase inhibitor [Pseudooceanicola]